LQANFIAKQKLKNDNRLIVIKEVKNNDNVSADSIKLADNCNIFEKNGYE